MANRAPTFQKREKEMRRQQKQQEKQARRRATKDPAPDTAPPVEGEEDPDIAGIVCGPQTPQPAWLVARRATKPGGS